MADDDPLIRQLLLLFILILISFAFSCIEMAVITTNKNKLNRLSEEGDKRAIRLLRLTSSPAKFLATIQVGNTLAGFMASAFAANQLSVRFSNWLTGLGIPIAPSVVNMISVIIITLILAYINIVLGELVPKRIAMKNAEKISLATSGPILIISKLFAPIVWLLSISTNGLLRLLHIDPHTADEVITEEEIRMMVDAGSKSGAIDAVEKVIIHNLFEFDNKTAAEVMTHRTDVVLLWQEEDDTTWENTIIESRHSHFPICGEDQDDIIGVLNSRDYFRLKERNRLRVMGSAVKLAQFVPESVRTDVLFKNMKKNRNHIAIVLDEYGGMSGVITMNDLLEELVGDLEDDQTAPPERPEIEAINETTWRVSGTAPLYEVAEALNTDLPTDEYDSFAGMVFGLLGLVPEDGQTPMLEEFGLTIQITEIKEHRLESAEVKLITL